MRQADPRATLEKLLRRQRVLAWCLSGLTLATTVGFFGLMGVNAPFLAQRLPGHSLSAANVLAAAIIMLFLGAIVLFGRQANRIDELSGHGEPRE
jgi:uncharacterized membrane protein (DUF485 family)